MPQTMMQRGVSFLHRNILRVAKEIVQYQDGPDVIEQLEVAQGDSAVENYVVDDQDGTYKAIDWYVDVDKLVIKGQRVEPSVGAEIRRTGVQGEQETYMVLPRQGGRHFEVVDERIRMYRIHTKFNGT